MALSLRSYLFEEDGAIKRVPRRVVEGLIFGNDAMLQYANTVQRAAAVIVENEDGKPLQIVSAEGSFSGHSTKTERLTRGYAKRPLQQWICCP